MKEAHFCLRHMESCEETSEIETGLMPSFAPWLSRVLIIDQTKRYQSPFCIDSLTQLSVK